MNLEEIELSFLKRMEQADDETKLKFLERMNEFILMRLKKLESGL